MARRATTNSSGNKFTFVVVNSLGSGGDQSLQTSKDIRSHVTREARRRKKAGESSSHPGRESPLPFQTGRFRLGGPSSKSEVITPSSRTKKLPSSRGNHKDDDAISKLAMETIAKWPPHLQPSDALDPFGNLPISLGSRQQNLLYYYDRYFVQNSVAFNPQRRLMNIASADPAWLNATFAIIALCFNFHTGASQKLSADALYYRGQALHLVNQRLANPSSQVDDSTIGAVATLCNFDVMSGYLVTATAHISGLEQLVKLRGGIDKLPSEQKMLLNVISWCDMAYATNWGGPPRFPELRSLAMPSEFHISTCSQEEAIIPNDLQIELCPIEKNVYYLSCLFDGGLESTTSRNSFAQTIYSTQHKLLHTLSSLRKVASESSSIPKNNSKNDPQGSIISAVDKTSVQEDIDKLIPCRASLLTSNIYIDLALRQLSPRADMHTIVISRLQEILCLLSPSTLTKPLTAISNSIFSNWNNSVERLLWIAFIGGAASEGRPHLRSFFVSLLVKARDDLMLVDEAHMRVVLRLFGWVETWSGEHCRKLWVEMEWWSVRETVNAGGSIGEEDEERDAEWEIDVDLITTN